MFVKPAAEGSSVGVVKVKEKGRLKSVYERLKHLQRRNHCRAIYWRRRIFLPRLERQRPANIHHPATEFYDYEAKYNRDDTVYQCPSEDLSEAEENLMRSLAVRGAQAIGAEGCVRVDFLKDTDGKLYLLEINTLPGGRATV